MAVSHSYFQRDGLAATGYIDDYAYAKAAKQSSKVRPVLLGLLLSGAWIWHWKQHLYVSRNITGSFTATFCVESDDTPRSSDHARWHPLKCHFLISLLFAAGEAGVCLQQVRQSLPGAPSQPQGLHPVWHHQDPTMEGGPRRYDAADQSRETCSLPCLLCTMSRTSHCTGGCQAQKLTG